MDYSKLGKSELMYLLTQREDQVKDLQEKLIDARHCANCINCANGKCKNNIYHKLVTEGS